MGHFVLTDAVVLLGGLDLSGDTNSVALDINAAMLDDSTFGSSWEATLPGLKKVEGQASGHRTLGDDASEHVLFDNLGVQDSIALFSPDGGQAGETAYGFKSVQATYNQADTHGEIAPFDASFSGNTVGFRGQVLHELGSQTSTGSTTGVEVGAASATQTAYGVLHVTSASAGDTLDVIVESDVDGDFNSPTTRLTFSQASATGAQWQSLAGAVTDTFWRITYTIAGTDPDFTFAVALGIQ